MKEIFTISQILILKKWTHLLKFEYQRKISKSRKLISFISKVPLIRINYFPPPLSPNVLNNKLWVMEIIAISKRKLGKNV